MFLAAMCLAGWLRGGDVERDRQVDAARIAAQARIVEMIADEPLGRGITVGSYLDRMDARRRLWQTVSAAQQVGGVRWIDDGTCQVRVEVPAMEVAQLVLDTALTAPNKSPLSYDQLEQKLAQWARRSFSATAGSLSPERAMMVAPPAGQAAWAGVDAAQRRALIDSARMNASRRLVDSFAVEPAIDDAARAQLVEWASSQPVTSVQFRDSRAVDVTIAYNSSELVNAIKEFVPGFSQDAAEVLSTTAAPTITGSSVEEARTTARKVVVIPAAPPAWVDTLIDVSADATFKSSALKTARLADDAAQKALLESVYALALNDGTILGDRAAEDAAVAQAIERAVSASRVSKVSYRADGSVTVRLALPGKTVWHELSTAAGSQ